MCTCENQLQPHDRMERVCPPEPAGQEPPAPAGEPDPGAEG